MDGRKGWMDGLMMVKGWTNELIDGWMGGSTNG